MTTLILNHDQRPPREQQLAEVAAERFPPLALVEYELFDEPSPAPDDKARAQERHRRELLDELWAPDHSYKRRSA